MGGGSVATDRPEVRDEAPTSLPVLDASAAPDRPPIDALTLDAVAALDRNTPADVSKAASREFLPTLAGAELRVMGSL